MREQFEYEGTATGEYKCGLYAIYAGQEYPAVYLGVGRFILYSTMANEHFTFPMNDGRYLLQTDMRDELLTRVNEIRMVGVTQNDYENVMVRGIYEEGVIISTYNPDLAARLELKPVKELGYTGIVDREILCGIYEERDYLWNPQMGVYATFCQSIQTDSRSVWFAENDRLAQLYVLERKQDNE